MTDTIDALLKRIEALEKRLSPQERPSRARKPVNGPAFDKAVEAFGRGNRRPLAQYMATYSVPKN